ncbi:hypothetical protein OSB04_026152 [Centaurea solstitialis]|uniref:PAR1 protein n=1 Tax=Centaurea solstitialis TaxID=347529 RepID=A0AA38W912_9ASTR|nr:hypothetical protein OSB04_026152 [Centaurea solstitialis]
MDSLNSLKGFLVFMTIFTFSIQTTLGNIACENLKKDACAFAVSSSGKRCVLEKTVRRTGEEVFVCSTSQIDTGKLTNWIETDECLEACGLDRNILGISSDSLLESQFTRKLCSTRCYNGCPNIVDLYFNLAVGEGVYLPSLCQAQGDNKRRWMSEISRNVAPGPTIPISVTTDGSPSVAPSPIPIGVVADGSPSVSKCVMGGGGFGFPTVAPSPIPIGVTNDVSPALAPSPLPIGVTVDGSLAVAPSPIPIGVTTDGSLSVALPDLPPLPLPLPPIGLTADGSLAVGPSPIPVGVTADASLDVAPYPLPTGVYLPSLCQAQGDSKRRGMSKIRSSDNVAPGPAISMSLMVDGSPNAAPSPIPISLME